MAFNGTPTNSTNRNAAASGSELGQIEYFSSTRAIAATGKHVPMDGKNNLWTDWPVYASSMESIPPTIQFGTLTVNASEAINSTQNSFGAFKSFGTDVWIMPSNTANVCTKVVSTTWSGATASDITVGATGGSPYQCVTSADNSVEGCLVTYHSTVNRISYSTATDLASGWTDINLNVVTSLPSGTKALGACNSGTSGRWYCLFYKTSQLYIEYSGVDTVGSGWTSWGGTVPTLGATSSKGDIAVKEGSMWMWSADASPTTGNPGRIYGASSLGGAASILLDISPNTSMHFFLTYDIADDIFIAIPNVANYPIYTSSDDGTTWTAGDTVPATPQHHAVKYDTTDSTYIIPFGEVAVYPFCFLRLDAAGKARIINVQEESISNQYASGWGADCRITVDPDNSIVVTLASSISTREIYLNTDLATEFSTPRIFRQVGLQTNDYGLPMSTYPAIKVAN